MSKSPGAQKQMLRQKQEERRRYKSLWDAPRPVWAWSLRTGLRPCYEASEGLELTYFCTAERFSPARSVKLALGSRGGGGRAHYSVGDGWTVSSDDGSDPLKEAT